MVRHRAPLTIKQILAWADAHHKCTGKWPTNTTGPVHEAPNEKWATLSRALAKGSRGLPSGGSLAQLLQKQGRKRSRHTLPRLSIKQIRAWADANHKRTGSWPIESTGPVHEAPNENWSALSHALAKGSRGLPSGGSLAQLLGKHGRKRNLRDRPRLSTKQILAWADAHHKRTGKWPIDGSGPVHEAPNENWLALSRALATGFRGLSGGGSLAQLLAKHGRKKRYHTKPRLSIKQVLTWSDAYRRLTGQWPRRVSGKVRGERDETWQRIDEALRGGLRGFSGRHSLLKLLSEHRGVRPRLTVKQILSWADAHRHRTGKAPTVESGAVTGAPGETWGGIDSAVKAGDRWSSVRTSLAHILASYRGKRYLNYRPRLTIEQVLAWADAHHRRTGKWPQYRTGTVHLSSGVTWQEINEALVGGFRGFPGGSSLARLLQHRRGVRNVRSLPNLSTEQILKWADAYYELKEDWPRTASGIIPRSGGESWRSINYALTKGSRGVSGGWSLFRFLNCYRHSERDQQARTPRRC